MADVGLGCFSSLIWWRGLIGFGFDGVPGVIGVSIFGRGRLSGPFSLRRMASFGVRLPQAGFSFRLRPFGGGSIPGYV